MVKVCHMTSVHKNNDARIFKKQCVSLASVGYDVTLVAHGHSFESNGVKIVGVPAVGGGRLRRMTRGAKSVYKKAIEIDADIYHIHDPELLPYALKLKNKDKKVIFDSHEIYNLQILHKAYLPKVLRKIIATVYDMYETKVCRKIDAVIVPCAVNGSNHFLNRAVQSALIDNTPDLSEFYDKFDPTYLKKDAKICYLGGLTYERGITHLIKAADKAGAILVLGGIFSPERYFEQVKRLKEYRCVDYRGFLEKDGILEALKESQIGVSVLLNKGQYHILDNLPTKVYEYMSMGLPVVISDCAHARKINDKYNCFILVPPDDIDQISTAIRYLIDNPEVAKAMGLNGRRAIAEEFNWSIEERKLIDLYKRLTEV